MEVSRFTRPVHDAQAPYPRWVLLHFLLKCHLTLATGGVGVSGMGAIRSSRAVAHELLERVSNRCIGCSYQNGMSYTYTCSHTINAHACFDALTERIDAYASICGSSVDRRT